jgi:hypothetical protein
LQRRFEGDGGLGGDHTRGGEGPVAGGLDVQQRDGVGMRAPGLHRAKKFPGTKAEQQRPDGHSHISAGEHLLLGQPS